MMTLGNMCANGVALSECSVALAVLVAVTVFITDGYFQSAKAQCVVDNKKVFIDPHLVPQRPHLTEEQFRRGQASFWLSDEQKKAQADAYYSQYQPIQMPFGSGYVLISPIDPCRQQYIPLPAN